MNATEQTEILRLLDFERQTVIYPGVTRWSDAGIVRDVSADGKNGEIVYSCCSEAEVDGIIAREMQTARDAHYELEWKVYGHDQPHCLGDRLEAAGFEPDEKEAFMAFLADDEALGRFGKCGVDIRRVVDRSDLRDVQRIWEEGAGESVDREIERHASTIENHPDNISVYVAYVEGEPAACGRIYFHADSKLAVIHGGQTRERFRNRGLYTQIVAVRIREALSRGIGYVCTDALPASEPILRRHGFEVLTHTHPFCFSG